MAKILLDYVFPISVIEPTPAASTAFLKQVCIVVKPKSGRESDVGTITQCSTMVQVAALTDNVEAQQLFNAGMNRVFVLLADDLQLAVPMDENAGDFWTVLISSDFTDLDLSIVPVDAVAATIKIGDLTFTAKTAGDDGNDITIAFEDSLSDGTASATVVGSAISVAIEAGVTPASAIAAAIAGSTPANALVAVAVDVGDESDPQAAQAATNLAGGADATTEPGSLDVGAFGGVVGFSSSNATVCRTFGTAPRRCGFFRADVNGAKNMFFAFGKILSNQTNWTNQQYIAMPFNDAVGELGDANALFDDRVSFVLNDDEFGNRLALFVAGGKAITAPYISENLIIDLQSAAVSWISANQPDYTITNAALLEDNLQTKVIQEKYIEGKKWITAGVVEIKLLEDNFVASGSINISEPKALWRVFGEMRSTL